MASDILSELFIQIGGSPMQFSMRNCWEFEELRVKIENHGGNLTMKMGPNSIRLLPKNDARVSSYGDTFKSQFIDDCIKEGKIVHIENYRVEDHSCYDSKVNPMLILLGEEKWSDYQPIHKRGEMSRVDSPFFDENVSNDAVKQRSVHTNKKAYSRKEKMAIIEYIVKRNRYHEVKGRAMWEEMENSKICPGRSWQSLKEHYRRNIINTLPQFKLKESVVKRLLKPYSAFSGNRRTKKIGTDSDSDDDGDDEEEDEDNDVISHKRSTDSDTENSDSVNEGVDNVTSDASKGSSESKTENNNDSNKEGTDNNTDGKKIVNEGNNDIDKDGSESAVNRNQIAVSDSQVNREVVNTCNNPEPSSSNTLEPGISKEDVHMTTNATSDEKEECPESLPTVSDKVTPIQRKLEKSSKPATCGSAKPSFPESNEANEHDDICEVVSDSSDSQTKSVPLQCAIPLGSMVVVPENILHELSHDHIPSDCDETRDIFEEIFRNDIKMDYADSHSVTTSVSSKNVNFNPISNNPEIQSDSDTVFGTAASSTETDTYHTARDSSKDAEVSSQEEDAVSQPIPNFESSKYSSDSENENESTSTVLFNDSLANQTSNVKLSPRLFSEVETLRYGTFPGVVRNCNRTVNNKCNGRQQSISGKEINSDFEERKLRLESSSSDEKVEPKRNCIRVRNFTSEIQQIADNDSVGTNLRQGQSSDEEIIDLEVTSCNESKRITSKNKESTSDIEESNKDSEELNLRLGTSSDEVINPTLRSSSSNISSRTRSSPSKKQQITSDIEESNESDEVENRRSSIRTSSPSKKQQITSNIEESNESDEVENKRSSIRTRSSPSKKQQITSSIAESSDSDEVENRRSSSRTKRSPSKEQQITSDIEESNESDEVENRRNSIKTRNQITSDIAESSESDEVENRRSSSRTKRSPSKKQQITSDIEESNESDEVENRRSSIKTRNQITSDIAESSESAEVENRRSSSRTKRSPSKKQQITSDIEESNESDEVENRRSSIKTRNQITSDTEESNESEEIENRRSSIKTRKQITSDTEESNESEEIENRRSSSRTRSSPSKKQQITSDIEESNESDEVENRRTKSSPSKNRQITSDNEESNSCSDEIVNPLVISYIKANSPSKNQQVNSDVEENHSYSEEINLRMGNLSSDDVSMRSSPSKGKQITSDIEQDKKNSEDVDLRIATSSCDETPVKRIFRANRKQQRISDIDSRPRMRGNEGIREDDQSSKGQSESEIELMDVDSDYKESINEFDTSQVISSSLDTSSYTSAPKKLRKNTNTIQGKKQRNTKKHSVGAVKVLRNKRRMEDSEVNVDSSESEPEILRSFAVGAKNVGQHIQVIQETGGSVSEGIDNSHSDDSDNAHPSRTFHPSGHGGLTVKIPRKTTRPRKPLRGKDVYSMEEDMEILRYIEGNREFHRVGGREMWQEMARSKNFKHRTWHSLKERFRKRIILRLHTYLQFGLSEEGVRRFAERVPIKQEPQKRAEESDNFRQPYSNEEDQLIVGFICKNKRYSEVGGRALWTLMADSVPGINGRTWLSLKERFRKSILPNINKFGLSKEEINHFKMKNKNKEKKKKKKKKKEEEEEEEEEEEVEEEEEEKEEEEAENVRNKESQNKVSRLYSNEEDQMIVNFINKNESYSKVSGQALWTSMAKNERGLRGRSWYSLKGRFLKNILPKIHKFNLSVKEVENFRNKGTGIRKKPNFPTKKEGALDYNSDEHELSGTCESVIDLSLEKSCLEKKQLKPRKRFHKLDSDSSESESDEENEIQCSYSEEAHQRFGTSRCVNNIMIANRDSTSIKPVKKRLFMNDDSLVSIATNTPFSVDEASNMRNNLKKKKIRIISEGGDINKNPNRVRKFKIISSCNDETTEDEELPNLNDQQEKFGESSKRNHEEQNDIVTTENDISSNNPQDQQEDSHSEEEYDDRLTNGYIEIHNHPDSTHLEEEDEEGSSPVQRRRGTRAVTEQLCDEEDGKRKTDDQRNKRTYDDNDQDFIMRNNLKKKKRKIIGEIVEEDIELEEKNDDNLTSLNHASSNKSLNQQKDSHSEEEYDDRLTNGYIKNHNHPDSTHSEEEDDDESSITHHHSSPDPSPVQTRKRNKEPRAKENIVSRQPYSRKEDRAIVEFINRNKRYSEVGGQILWTLMADSVPEINGRTWLSLKGRFLKSILPNIQKFGLSKEEINNFKMKKEVKNVKNKAMTKHLDDEDGKKIPSKQRNKRSCEEQQQRPTRRFTKPQKCQSPDTTPNTSNNSRGKILKEANYVHKVLSLRLKKLSPDKLLTGFMSDPEISTVDVEKISSSEKHGNSSDSQMIRRSFKPKKSPLVKKSVTAHSTSKTMPTNKLRKRRIQEKK